MLDIGNTRRLRTSAGAIQALKFYFELARLRTCLPSLLSYAIGVNVAGKGWGWLQVAGALVAVIVPALANMHNTLTDREEDSVNIPGRAKLLKSAEHLPTKRVMQALALVVLVFSALAGWATLLVAILGILALHQYSAPPLRAKASPVLGGAIFVQVVSLPLAAGALVSSDWWHPNLADPKTVLVAYLLACLFFSAKFFVKNVPDYDGDKAANLRTTATMFSSQRRAAIAAVAVSICAYLAIAAVLGGIAGHWDEFLITVLWIPLVAVNGVTMIRSCGVARLTNRTMAWDMYISSFYLAALLICISPTGITFLILAVCAAVLTLSEFGNLDSRSAKHIQPVKAEFID
ncbi:UbiA family prenyltransferase [Prescottella equi]